MLHLARPSDPEWFERIEDALPTILIDHTHLEKRAASTAMSMIFRYTERPSLARRMSDVVTEEMDHFVRMLDVLEARGIEHRLFERRLRVRRDQSCAYPGYRFDWNALTIEATVLAYDGLRQAPLSPVDGKPMRRASIKKVKRLLAS